MERGRFNSLARLLGGEGTRRAALGALVGLAALDAGSRPDAEASRKSKRRKKRRKKNRPAACYGTNACPPPESGKDLDDCDYSNTNVFVDANAGGSSFRRGNFSGADMDGADLQGTKFLDANLRDASLVGVDLRGASLNGACLLNTDFLNAVIEGPIFADAFVCNTRLPNNAIADRDCGNLPSCCVQ